MRRLLAVMAVIVAIVAGQSPTGRVAAQEPNRAGIVIYFGDGRTSSVCLSFDEPEITGADLLRRAGFPVVASSAWGGGATCMIDDVGCADPNDCWCQCHGAPCRYWAYFTLDAGDWRYSPIGAAQRKLHDGDVDGWAWGVGSAGSAEKLPPPTTFQDVCPEPPPAPPSPIATSQQPASPQAPAEVATPTSVPLSTSAVEQTPHSTATNTGVPTIVKSTSQPTAVAPTTKEESAGFPWQIPAFVPLAVALIAIAFVLSRRRSRG